MLADFKICISVPLMLNDNGDTKVIYDFAGWLFLNTVIGRL